MRRIVYIFYCIRHFIVANSRHGVHSPFVYKLTEEVVYRRHSGREIDGETRAWKLLHEIGAYFGVTYTKDVTVEGLDNALVVQVDAFSVDDVATLQKRFRYIVIPDIYKSAKARRYWRSISDDQRFIVCLDFFYFGILYFRSEQPKQVFRLRFPFWRY